MQLVDDGFGHMQFVRTKANQEDVRRVIYQALQEDGATYEIRDGFLSPEQLEEVQQSIAAKDLKFVNQGNGYLKLVRSFDISGAAKNFTGSIGKYNVYLEKLPTVGGGSSEVVNIAGRSVVVVNVNGHRIPFYVSSGQAGKDALGIPSGKWYPLAGIGQTDRGFGWFNKMADMNHNPVPELDEIASRLEKNLDPSKLKKMALDAQEGSGILPDASSAAGRIINSEFPNGVVPDIEVIGQGIGRIDPKYEPLFRENLQRIINIFK